MIALNIECERIVNKAMEIRRANKLKLIDLIRLTIVNLDINIELAKEYVISSRSLGAACVILQCPLILDAATGLVVRQMLRYANHLVFDVLNKLRV